MREEKEKPAVGAAGDGKETRTSLISYHKADEPYGQVRRRVWQHKHPHTQALAAHLAAHPLPPEALARLLLRHLAIYALSSPHGNVEGVFPLPPAYVTADTGMPAEVLELAMQALEAEGFLLRDGDAVMVANAIQYDANRNNANHWPTRLRNLDRVRNTRLLRRYYEQARKHAPGLAGAIAEAFADDLSGSEDAIRDAMRDGTTDATPDAIADAKPMTETETETKTKENGAAAPAAAASAERIEPVPQTHTDSPQTVRTTCLLPNEAEADRSVPTKPKPRRAPAPSAVQQVINAVHDWAKPLGYVVDSSWYGRAARGAKAVDAENLPKLLDAAKWVHASNDRFLAERLTSGDLLSVWRTYAARSGKVLSIAEAPASAAAPRSLADPEVCQALGITTLTDADPFGGSLVGEVK